MRVPSLIAKPALLFLTLSLLPGCGEEVPTLDGSLGEVVSLDYLGAELSHTEEQLSLHFLTAGKAGDDTVLRVLVNVAGIPLTAPTRIDLAEAMPAGGQRGFVTRKVYEDTREVLPELARGYLLLRSTPQPNQTLKGELSLTFVQGSDWGSGRTVFGSFEALVLP